MKRQSGVLMHISSLPGDYSIGGFSDHARYFIDFLADCGFSWWQVLPFTLVDECNSPYKSYSTFAGNPYFIDLDVLHRKGLITAEELNNCRQQTPYSCEYGRLYHTRYAVLRHAADRAREQGMSEAVKAFMEQNRYLDRFCRFMALKEANNQRAWLEWTVETADEGALFMWQWIQYEFFAQWKEIKDYANRRGVRIMGDLPFYVAYDSADVWGNRELFQLDSDGRPTHEAGVPPDYFAKDGQLWGNPLYDWQAMEQDGFAWWHDRLAHMLTMFDGVRIDHFRAVESYWSVPASAQTAREGNWEQGPGMKLVNVMRHTAGDNLIVAEDLGDITDAVRQLVTESGFPGMRVFQFGFLGDYDTPHAPHNYENNCVAYTGTHDNNTLLGYVWELDEQNRREMLDYCGYESPDWNHSYDSILQTMFRSNAGLVMLPIQDLLGYGSDTRLNIPGKADGNWQFRITREQLDSIDRVKFRRWNHIYRR